ncbi:MAG: DUF1592 domain-containing protein [Gemmataceae bacterium]|nr:DUF1592 domain-containing protein [Gemmataceae bacterium]MDW8266110.1 DUF1592 domain-containing protein [Gemmataceae bacterium]
MISSLDDAMALRTHRLCIALVLTAFSGMPAPAADLPERLKPFLEEHCLGCHDGVQKKGGLDLSSLGGNLTEPQLMAKWVRVHDRVAKGEMPPRGKVPADEKASFLSILSADLTKADQARKTAVIRRLNRIEYEHTLHDLLGIDVELAELLPEDGKAHGFDTVGEALAISSVQMQRYLQAGEKALDAAIRTGPRPERKSSRHSLADGRNEEYVGKAWLKQPDGAIVIFGGRFPPAQLVAFRSPADGLYAIRIVGQAYQSQEPVTFGLYSVQSGREARLDLLGFFVLRPGEPQTLEINARLRRGATLRLVPQLESVNYPELRRLGVEKYSGQGLAIREVEIDGPILDDWPGIGHRRLFGDLEIRQAEATKKKLPRPAGEVVSQNPSADAKRLLASFLPLAFRRPVGREQLDTYLRLFEAERQQGASFEEAMRTAYLAALCSPDFLFRVEKPGKLDDYALASRLSYFLWSSMPDDRLLDLARQGRLGRPGVLRAETERLLNDPKAQRFTRHFVGQWLDLRHIDFTMPDKQLYPEFDELLHNAMVRETEGFFNEVLHQRLSLLEFIDSDWTILNERLARHYRIPGVKGLEFRKVTLPKDSHRGGVLTHASVLRVSANGTTTSPVVRGAWVLDRILGEPPPPPPPGIPGVEPDIRGASTLRELLDKHRNLATCAGCHKHIDPPGFALENYDVMGGWRTHYRTLNKDFPSPPLEETFGKRVAWRVGPKVDASGQTADGKTFRDLTEYKQILLADKDRITRALVEKVATYATGRGMGFSDRPEIARIVAAVAARGYVFRELIHEVVQSELFRTK